MKRWGLGGFAAVALLIGLAFVNREAVLLHLVSIAASQQLRVGPHQEIAWSAGAGPSARPTGKRPPNIVLILADDLGWNDLSFGGGGVARGTVPTPNIDSIATDGVSFRNGYAGNATCAPSRAALLSGRYGTRFGFEFTPTPAPMAMLVPRLSSPLQRLRRPILHEDVELQDYASMGMPASEITIAELLSARGYHTVHIGKWHLGREDGMAPHEQGFDESLLMESGLYLPEDDPDVVNAKQAFDPIDRVIWAGARYAASFNGSAPFEPGGYLTDYYTEQAVEAIEANKDRPFFLYLAHWAPHTPLQASREDYEALSHIELHRERVYAAMIRALDRGVGQVLDALARNGLEENTLVLFTSDNGGAGYIGLPEVNRPFRGWKLSFFEGGIHVPYFMKWPGRISPGAVVDAPVHHFDLYTTAAAAAGAPLPEHRKLDGVDLLPFATGKADGVPHRALFWRSGASQSVLADGWKLNVSEPPGRTWLFDMNRDPSEQEDLATERPDKVGELMSLLREHNAQQAPSAWPEHAMLPINVDKDLSQADAPGDEFIYWSN